MFHPSHQYHRRNPLHRHVWNGTSTKCQHGNTWPAAAGHQAQSPQCLVQPNFSRHEHSTGHGASVYDHLSSCCSLSGLKLTDSTRECVGRCPRLESINAHQSHNSGSASGEHGHNDKPAHSPEIQRPILSPRVTRNHHRDSNGHCPEEPLNRREEFDSDIDATYGIPDCDSRCCRHCIEPMQSQGEDRMTINSACRESRIPLRGRYWVLGPPLPSAFGSRR